MYDERIMNHNRICTEPTDGSQLATFHRYLREVPTDDGKRLIVTHKVPAHQKPKMPVILVHGLGQNRYSWTLSKRSFENYLVANGFETFNAELRGHGLSRANGAGYAERFETYLSYDIPALVTAVRRISGRDKVFYAGHSLGAIISYCIGAALDDQLAGIVSIAGPYGLGAGNRTLQMLAKAGVLLERLTQFHRYHPKPFYVDLIGSVVKNTLFFFDNRFNRVPVQVWYPKSIERDILLERIEKGFDRTSFSVFWRLIEWGASGRFLGTDNNIDFSQRMAEMATPILFVAGDRDYVVPITSVRKAFDKVGSLVRELKVYGDKTSGIHFGHCDLICGRHAPRLIWPELLEWMNTRTP